MSGRLEYCVNTEPETVTEVFRLLDRAIHELEMTTEQWLRIDRFIDHFRSAVSIAEWKAGLVWPA